MQGTEVDYGEHWGTQVQTIVDGKKGEDFLVYNRNGVSIPLLQAGSNYVPSKEEFPIRIFGPIRASFAAAVPAPSRFSAMSSMVPALQPAMPTETGVAPEDAFGNRDMLSETMTDLTDRYIMHEKLGEGTYGTVYKAKCKQTHQYVAIKRIRVMQEDDGVPAVALREISLLKELNNRHVVKLLDVYSSPSNLYLEAGLQVFERMEMDLRMYLKRHGKMEGSTLRSALWQCACGIEFCHSRRVIHRDLKPQNVLLEFRGRMRLVLADFGLARLYNVPLKVYTHDIVTLWYRPPEILLGQEQYGPSTDIWSLSCIFAEMATARALFTGDSEIDTIFKIFRVLGTPDEEVWPGVNKLRDFKQTFPVWRNTDFAEVRALAGHRFNSDAMDVLRRCLKYNSAERPSAKKMLALRYFVEDTNRQETCTVDGATDAP